MIRAFRHRGFPRCGATHRGAAALLLLVSLIALSPAQSSAEFHSKKKALLDGMKSKDADARITAIEAFQGCGDPAGVKVLFDQLTATEKALAKVRVKFEKVGKKLHEELAKITNVRMSQAAYQAAQARLAPLRAEHERYDEQIADHERVSRALMKGVGAVVSSVPDDLRIRAVQEIVSAYEWGSKPRDKALALKAMGFVNEPMIATTLIGAARLGRNPGVRVAAFESMAKMPKPEMVEVAVAALQDKFWQVRVAALVVIRKVGGKDAIEPLITSLEHAEGRMIDELVDTLKTLTKVNHHDNVALWRSWWKDHKARFEGRGSNAGVPGEVAKGDQEEGGRAGTYFYGIRSRSKHIIYVLDISGSMRWTLQTRYREGGPGGLPPDAPDGKSKLDNAVKELLKSITALPDNGTFNIVTYAIDHAVWKKKMQKSDKKGKAAARKWAKRLQGDGATNIFDALERAFGFVGRGSFDKGYGLAADTIFFLSDGQPNRGRVVHPDAIIREIRKLNDLKKVKVHCIGLGTSTNERFMRRLARENGGQYVHVGPGR